MSLIVLQSYRANTACIILFSCAGSSLLLPAKFIAGIIPLSTACVSGYVVSFIHKLQNNACIELCRVFIVP
jgi:hypothetical protein